VDWGVSDDDDDEEGASWVWVFFCASVLCSWVEEGVGSGVGVLSWVTDTVELLLKLGLLKLELMISLKLELELMLSLKLELELASEVNALVG